MKIDKKSFDILYYLSINSRMSLKEIGKKVNLKKNTISYRINRLTNQGIIKNFYTYIDAYKLGFISFRFYVTYQYTTPKIQDNIISYFLTNESVWRLISIKGRYDLGVTVWVKDTNSFYSFWKKTMDMFGDYLSERTFSACIQSFDYPFSFLAREQFNKNDRDLLEMTGGGKTIDIDEVESNILKILANNARISYVKIAQQLKVSPTMVKYKIKRLEKMHIIQGYGTALDLSQLDYEHYKIDIYLKDHSKRSEIINSLKYNPNLVHIGTSAGISDLEIEFYVKRIDEVFDIMTNIIKKFPNAIKNYKHFNIQQVYKLNYMPII
jgi:DNA-binding Lrp family transcriptional regulator